MRLRWREMSVGLWAIAGHMHARRRDGCTSPSHDLAGVHVGVRAGTMVSPASTLRGSVVKQRHCRERRGWLFQFKLQSACGRLQVVVLVPGDRGIAVMDVVRSMAVSADAQAPKVGLGIRSEEHPSELQSIMRLSYAAVCLKKKKKTT